MSNDLVVYERFLKYLGMLFLLISCSNKNEKNDWGYFSDVQFSFDTLIVDSSNDVLFVKHGLLNSDISWDGKYFFNFNMDDLTLEKIDLNQLRLESKIPFEKEGPNGLGVDFGWFKIKNQNQFIITNFKGTSVFSFDGQKLMSIKYDSFFLENNHISFEEYVGASTYLDDKSEKLIALIHRRDSQGTELAVFNLDSYEVLRVPLPDFHQLSKFAITLKIGKSSIILGPKVALNAFDNKIVLSNPVTSRIAIYDTVKDSLYEKNFNSRLTANQKLKTYKLEHFSDDSLEEEYKQYRQEINFLPPIWDSQNQIFYRFSYQNLPSKLENVQSKIFISAIDKDFNLIGEKEVIGLNIPPSKPFSGEFPKHFVKDREIWVFQNINDEMGFIRIKMIK